MTNNTNGIPFNQPTYKNTFQDIENNPNKKTRQITYYGVSGQNLKKISPPLKPEMNPFIRNFFLPKTESCPSTRSSYYSLQPPEHPTSNPLLLKEISPFSKTSPPLQNPAMNSCMFKFEIIPTDLYPKDQSVRYPLLPIVAPEIADLNLPITSPCSELNLPIVSSCSELKKSLNCKRPIPTRRTAFKRPGAFNPPPAKKIKKNSEPELNIKQKIKDPFLRNILN